MKARVSFTVVALSVVSALCVAQAQEATFTAQGKHVSLVLNASREKGFTSKDRLVRWLDEACEAMAELTGTQPNDGAMVVIREAPAPPQADGAPKPVVVERALAAQAVAQANDNIMPFDLIVELARSFDAALGKWTTWNEASADWQASWKLDYAYETMPDQTFKAEWPADAGGFPPPRENATVAGRQLMDSYYLFHGDGYLADATRRWDTMTGDELHSFFLRLQRQYGWEPFKRMYRTYARFEALGYDPPETPEGKLTLMAAILEHALGVEIVPAFARWRMPVTAGQIGEMGKRYPIADPDAAGPGSPEAAAALVEVTIANEQPGGWMRDGYGRLRFAFRNTGELPTKMIYWQARWMVGDKPFIADWEEPDEDGTYRGWYDDGVVHVPAGEEVVLMKTGGLDSKMLGQLGPDVTPLLKGTAKFRTGGVEFTIPWEFEVPEAVMTEKLVRVEGKHMAYEITQRHYDMLGENRERLIRWLDQAYEAMAELTGYTPYDGKIITIVESPDHPYYAYAGNPIVMDTTYMDDLVAIVNRGEMPFGWIHELGHDFDIADNLYGGWYESLEAQANIKVVYAFGHMPDPDWKSEWGVDKSALYPAPHKGILLDGGECMDKKFLFEGDDTLADPSLPWDRTFCQHIFLQRVARVYGWEPIKKLYRTYKILADQGSPQPETDVERAQLMAAILSETVGADMVPAFQRWKVPVTQADVEAMKAKYPIEEAVRSIVLPGKETAKAE